MHAEIWSGCKHEPMCRISVIFVDKDGKDQEVRAPLGKNLLEVAHDNEIDLEGACQIPLCVEVPLC